MSKYVCQKKRENWVFTMCKGEMYVEVHGRIKVITHIHLFCTSFTPHTKILKSILKIQKFKKTEISFKC